MEKEISIEWKGNMAFEANVDGFRVMMDAVPEVGGQDLGPTPKPLLMASLGGCTAMDVISMLKKMRQEVETMSIKLIGTLTEEHPKHYTAIHLVYQFTGKDLDPDKLRKAIDLSQDRHCGVSETLRKGVKISYDVEVI